jgi:L-galactose dehydrogenase
MEYRTLGNTSLSVSLLGFGTGGPSGFGKPGSDASSRRGLIAQCLQAGITLFDTSAHYGESETLLGEALRGEPRDSYVLSTKWPPARWWSPAGVGGEDGPLHEDPDELARSVEASLSRLRTDVIDIMFFHGVRPSDYEEVVRRYYPVMARLREQGKVRFVGISSRYIADPGSESVATALRQHPQLWDVVMIKYGILNQSADREILPLATKHGVGVLDMSAVRTKLSRNVELERLIADWKERGLIRSEGLPEDRPLDFLLHDEVRCVVHAGYKFAAEHPAIASVLTGTTDPQHLAENVIAMEKPFLPAEDRQRLVELFGHIVEWT